MPHVSDKDAHKTSEKQRQRTTRIIARNVRIQIAQNAGRTTPANKRSTQWALHDGFVVQKHVRNNREKKQVGEYARYPSSSSTHAGKFALL